MPDARGLMALPQQIEDDNETGRRVNLGVNKDEAWERICRRLRAELGEDVFASWFGRLELDQVADGTAFLSVPTKFLKSWIQSHYTDKILAILADEFGNAKRISIGVRPTSRVGRSFPADAERDNSPENAEPAARPARSPVGAEVKFFTGPDKKTVREISDAEALNGSPLDRRLSFANFLVGRSNQLAFAAAKGIAAADPNDPLLSNPLYLHASVGLGKTHLLQAIAHDAMIMKRRVIYLTAEKFMYGFVAALKAQTAIAFKEKLRTIDILVIDDVQFLQGKSIQQEFCHTLNALIDAGRQIVIAADRPPADLESLDERVRSRLAGGLCVEMGALDEALRIKILETRIGAAKLVHPYFDVPQPVIAYVASVIQTNGRDLDGAVNRLLAHASLTSVPLTIEIAETAIRDLVRTKEPKRVKIEEIQKLVASHFNVSRADILSSRRTANVVRPRQIAMYLSKIMTLRSLPEIGRRFGGRDHTTVLHAVRKIENLASTDNHLSEELELLKRMLME
ncbi:chromosomal replication initiator protein DnaA [Beijerinckia indica]|uniref:Chromosomal replication initiator protein DnaA n=1 Tax=Beijerinckia indica subsp. indica (strain ATCC 9039 / DSM 1715 / NCIMB 8712) TaxID=395963 RepID=B2IAW2_BEII9|nr:chromosomal replication initiator protein DnaA [Beijerinckia indica]ACB93662.1 chromosomal replication initiator protein DnaA [Beijerinckia indica subsp. indica ATCC 9039]